MNPYLEQDIVWNDFHQSVMPAARSALTAQVVPRYVVKVEEQLFVHERPADRRRLVGRGDVSVSAPGPFAAAAVADVGTAAVEAPAYAYVPVAADVERHAYLEIRDRQNWELITVVELLSFANKRPGPDREQYLAKRRRYLLSSASLVEIDLLRGHPRMPAEGVPPCDYCVLVSGAADRPRVGVWAISLRERLPTIPVPLRAGEPNASLDLQALVHEVYDSAGYAHYIYSGAPVPPLSPEDAAWAAQFVLAAGT